MSGKVQRCNKHCKFSPCSLGSKVGLSSNPRLAVLWNLHKRNSRVTRELMLVFSVCFYFHIMFSLLFCGDDHTSSLDFHQNQNRNKSKNSLAKKKKIHEYDQFTENGWPHCTSQWMQNFEFVCWNSCPLNSHWLPSFGGPFLTLQLKGERLLLCLLSPSLPHSLLPPPPCSISSPFRSQLTSHLLREVIPDIIFMQLPLFFPTNQSLSPCFLCNTYFYGSHLVIY